MLYSAEESAGSISLISTGGNIDVDLIYVAGGIHGFSGDANGGEVYISAFGDVNIVDGIRAFSGEPFEEIGAIPGIDSKIVVLPEPGETLPEPEPEPEPIPIPTLDGESNSGNVSIFSQTGDVFIGGRGIHSYSYPFNEENIAFEANGGDIYIEAAGNIEVEQLATFAGSGENVTVVNEEPTPVFVSGDANAGNITVISHGGSIAINSGVDASAGLGNGGSVELGAAGDITTSDIRTNALLEGGAITLSSSGGSIDTTAGIANSVGGVTGGDVTLEALGNITTAGIGSTVILSGFNANSGNLRIDSGAQVDTTAGPLITASGSGTGGNIDIYAADEVLLGNVNARSFATTGGYIELQADGLVNWQGELETNRNRITFAAPVELAGDSTVRILAAGTIQFQDTLDGAHQLTLESNGGTVEFDRPVGSSEPLTALAVEGETFSSVAPVDITTEGDLLVEDILSESGIVLQSLSGTIQAGAIDASSTTTDAGNVSLEASNTIVNSIAAQSDVGSGGNVEVTTSSNPDAIGYFRAVETFGDRNGTTASISVAGAASGGTVIIRHGGNGEIPFIVGDADLNGTVGTITRGDDAAARSINPTGEYLFTYTQDQARLQIISIPNSAAVIAQPSPTLPALEPEALVSDNPITNLGFLIGDLLNAETAVERDPATGEETFTWQLPSLSTDEQVLLADGEAPGGRTLSQTVPNPAPSPAIGSIPYQSPLHSIPPLNLAQSPEDLIA
ncbi:MAG: hypothetical protein HC910_22980, partial [Spirulinaceae cyanobacterium SM2_1_0]|nr:hypothetical protein [Spirulinaceae cyanobacterium SM2_1_0]